MLIGKVDTILVERVRITVYDASAPIYAAISGPILVVSKTLTDIGGLWGLREENARLRDENERLRRWQSVALTLDAENRRLKTALRWIPDPEASYVTAHVVADAGGIYAKAVLLSVGPNHGLHKGEIALDERGLVGRITEVGTRTARILLITDMNSRVPVILESSRAHAILAGTNGTLPRLQYWSEGSVPKEGERVVTSAEANAFPANLPVGTVHYSANGVPEVEPEAELRGLDIVRIFDYGLGGLTPPEVLTRPMPGHR
jgi:rod shape-determining protein MreC